MAHILPFKGLMPQVSLAHKIVTLSADNYSIEQVKCIIEKNPLSYLSVIYPDFIDGKKTLPHSIQRFQKIYQRFKFFYTQQYLIQDAKPVYYFYQQVHPTFSFNGIIAAISVHDYLNGSIKIHEQTLSDREQKLKEYLKHCLINAEPVLFFYDKNITLQQIQQSIQSTTPYIAIELDGVQHRVWKSTDINTNRLIQNEFENMNEVFIGDGHHRSASSVLLYQETKHPTKSLEYFLGAFFQEDNLKIFSFHRLLKNIFIPDHFIEKLSQYFQVQEVAEYTLQRHTIGMFWNNKRYILKDHSSSLLLDADILYQYVLKKILGIEDIRNNTLIQYLPEYTHSINEVESIVKSGQYTLAFFLHPVSVYDIKRVAWNQQTMPPKSTYALPKLLNALVLYSLENSM